LADRIAVMREGRIEQIGAPRTLYRHPANRFVADFIGECNWLEGEIAAVDSGRARVRTAAGELLADTPEVTGVGARVWLGFRPEAGTLLGAPGEHTLPATVERVTYLGRVEQYRLRIGPIDGIKVLQTNPSQHHAPGESVALQLPPGDLILLPRG
ncbi:MAG: TOBE domain-containing protein, partial [Verrucomicrobiae bacterium]|nr:TOBE domain-containing protein [Verrucomicrobiae bacterium]